MQSRRRRWWPESAAARPWRVVAGLTIIGCATVWLSRSAAAQEFGFVLQAQRPVAEDAVQSLAFAPDGSWLVVVAKRGAQLFALGADGQLQPRGELPGLRKEPQAAAVSPDGKSLAVVDRGGALYLFNWDGAAQRLPSPVAAVPHAHRGRATAVAFTGDGAYVVSGGEDGKIRVWTPAGQPFAELGHDLRSQGGAIFMLAAVGAERLMLSIDGKRQIILWQVDTQQPLRPSTVDDDILSAAAGDEGKILALGLQRLTGNRSSLGEHLGGHLAGGRSRLASPTSLDHEIDSDDRVRLIDLQSGTQLRDIEGEHQDLTSVAVSPDGQFIAAAGSGAMATVWSTASGKRIVQIPCNQPATALAFAPDGKWLLIGTRQGTLALFRLSGVRPRRRPEPAQEILLALLEPSGVAAEEGRVGNSTARGPVPRVDSSTLRVRGRIKSDSPVKSLLVGGEAVTSLRADGSDGYIFNAYVPLPEAGRHRVEILVENQHGATAQRFFDVERAVTPPPAALGPGRRLALIVGVSHYADPSIDLAFAAQDAKALYQMLTNPALGPAAFQPEDVRLLLDRQATVNAINSGLRQFLRRARENDFVLFYFAGHGAPDPNRLQDLYLLAHDTSVKDIAGTGLLMTQVREAIAELTARDVLILTDACHSAGIAAPEGRRGSESNPINQAFLDKMLHASGGLAILTASEAAQLSQEDVRWGHHGVFTYFLLKGLAGDADTNGDHIVTLGELMEYVRRNVSRATHDEQIPAIGPTSFDRGLPLVIVGPAGSRSLTTPPNQR